MAAMKIRCGEGCPWIKDSPHCTKQRCEGITEVPPYGR